MHEWGRVVFMFFVLMFLFLFLQFYSESAVVVYEFVGFSKFFNVSGGFFVFFVAYSQRH